MARKSGIKVVGVDVDTASAVWDDGSGALRRAMLPPMGTGAHGALLPAIVPTSEEISRTEVVRRDILSAMIRAMGGEIVLSVDDLEAASMDDHISITVQLNGNVVIKLKEGGDTND